MCSPSGNDLFSTSNKSISRELEIEVDNLEQIQEALKIGVDGFLLDNMHPDIITQAVKITAMGIYIAYNLTNIDELLIIGIVLSSVFQAGV